MATTKSSKTPVGSTQWIQSERDQADQMLEQEVEEFGYSVKNELEWLNEHMADVFAKNSVNFADVFKTPGKLRGKTPRTARKQIVADRQPLTDIFAPNAQQSSVTVPKKSSFLEKVAHFQIAEDAENAMPVSFQQVTQKPIEKTANSDYHESPDSEMEVDQVNLGAATQDSGYATQSTQPNTQQSQVKLVQTHVQQPSGLLDSSRFEVDEERVSDESFVSAKEVSSLTGSKHQLNTGENLENISRREDERKDVIDDSMHDPPTADQKTAVIEPDEMQQEDIVEDIHSLSDTSTPEKVPQRKSSFNFSSLPAREPLAANRSIGARNSHLADAVKPISQKSTGKVFGVSHEIEEAVNLEDSPESKLHAPNSTQSLQERIKMLGKQKESRLPSQQALYPQLPMGEETEDGAEDHSDPPAVPPKASPTAEEVVLRIDDDDDWISPAKPAQQTNTHPRLETAMGSPTRPVLDQKSISTTAIPSPTRFQIDADARQQKATSVYGPHFPESTTPLGSPTQKKDGPLSASKSRLYSVLKSAKNIFASSASTSAAAKLEAHNASPLGRKSLSRPVSNEENVSGAFGMASALESAGQLQHIQQGSDDRPKSPERPRSVASFKSMLSSPSKRSGAELEKKREKERKEKEEVERKLEREREKEREKATKQGERREVLRYAENIQTSGAVAPPTQTTDSGKDEQDAQEMPPPPPPKMLLQGGKLRAPGRLIKPTREAGKPVPKPAPVSIRVASQSQRFQQPVNSLSQSQPQATQEDSIPPQLPPKQADSGASRATSAQGSRGYNAGGSNTQNARLKALEVAARKKEQEEREKAKKVEQKRELERKRQAKVEEGRRQEEVRKAEEQRKAREEKEAKANALRERERKAQEQREREREEVRRKQDAERKAREAHDLASAIERERAQQQSTMEQRPRGDVGGTLRQLTSKATVAPERSSAAARPPIVPNPAKPAKRHLAEEVDDSQAQQRPGPPGAPVRPGNMRNIPSYQQDGAKRRRTMEEEDEFVENSQHQGARNSVMAPPKRPSTFRKETQTKGLHGYSHTPSSTAQHASGIFKATVTSQHQMQHGKPGFSNHPSQFASGRIPFADNVNPPGAPGGHNGHHGSAVHPGFENAQGSNKFKTPARPGAPYAPHTKSAAKSSPLYANGDAIALPEIATDSEDEEDSENEGTGGFRAPSWVNSPALRELLTQQQLVDPESVFGPIGELKMDEVFKGAKNQDRLKRLRERGSSARWVQNGDAVTQEEKRRDREMREKVVRDGGWRYAPGT